MRLKLLSLIEVLLIISLPACVYASPNTSFTVVNPHAVVSQSPADDAAITKGIKTRIAESPILAPLNVAVSTHRGVVTLSGEVDSETQASLLVEMSAATIGVADVEAAKLHVKEGTQPIKDTYITAKIKGLFVREKIFGEKDIAAFKTGIETKDGVVYITGNVVNQEQINNAVNIIKKDVPEVKAVQYSVNKIVPR